MSGAKEDLWGTLQQFKAPLFHAVAAWCAFVPVATAVLYFALLPVLRAAVPPAKGKEEAKKEK